MQLDIDDVHVWHIEKKRHLDEVDSLKTLLSSDEIERAQRFKFERDQTGFIIFRGYLRKILAHYEKCYPDQLRFKYNTHGKPIIANPNVTIEFNISHTKEHALLAVALHAPIGIDIEKMEDKHNYYGIAKRFFSEEEYDYIVAQKENALHCFYRYWTCKEAFVKALGEGIHYGLNRFAIEFVDHQAANLVKTDDDTIDMDHWLLMTLEAIPDHVASIALSRRLLNIKYFGVDDLS
ncbi:MAG: 4'-phosphopantetheinyl transferase family protein [Gammaproteobacteria bacterium]